ncbi:MAG: RnfABCDGE type electron transport complex subunit B [Eubacteriales bacterium]|jgi:Na+-translocating ferredoxin:NAD+ oxidoreductase RNF subunit RnfB|nr:RnfABCDGE type electron transport complex subunit B [Eubacteriales bacterium]MDD4134663.1 RnfABCDGE type electron transport complex subunit B [Eubacteriales bacterium]NLO13475.1 RnfABCDGE type electron transport complex subunit B [Clostridiales bacterium]
MNTTAILSAVAVLGGLGVLFGLVLTFADKAFSVPVDERVARVREAVAGANCGACGYAGCDPYAAAVVSGEASITACTPGGQKTFNALAEIMGKNACDVAPGVARLLCQGENGVAKPRYDYIGPPSCHAATQMAGGPTACAWGCVGLGDCVKACQFDAMKIVNGIVSIDENKCTSCGLCVPACPRSLIKLLPRAAKVTVRCLNAANAKDAMAACSKACIACKRCEKACEFDAIHVIGNCAVIDPEKCTLCGECVKVCPTKCITHQA